MTDDSALSPALDAALQAALALPPTRLIPLAVEGQRYWLRRREVGRNGLRRLKKGDAGRALDAERAGLARMSALDLPAAPILAEGPDFVLTGDVGLPINAILHAPALPEADRHAALADGARALARLHKAGAAHGRPTIGAICWRKGVGATLIDVGAIVPAASARRQARDASLFLRSVLRVRRQHDGCFDTAAEAYRAEAPQETWMLMRRRALRARWRVPFARLALRVRPKAHALRAALLLGEALRN